MSIEPIDTVSFQPTFGYSNPLKTLFKKGKLPSVKYDFYGDPITKKTATLDHLLPKSKGGKSVQENYVLATAKNNHDRGSDDIHLWFNVENAKRYLKQFLNVKLKGLNGNSYICGILQNLNKQGVDITPFLDLMA